jgi:hypothetical protein
VIDNIWERKISEYFDLMEEFCCDEWTLDKILEYYGYSAEEYGEMMNEPMGRLFYEIPMKERIEAIYHLRSSYER